MTERNDAKIIDNYLVKRHYPRQNIEENLTFTFEPDPNLALLKNKIALHFTVDLPEAYIPSNGFAGKLFSSLSVEVNSQRISGNRSK